MCFLHLWSPVKRIKAIIFDSDGTLVDSEYAHYLAWIYALSRQNSSLSSREYEPYVGQSIETNAQLFAKKIKKDCAEEIIQDKRSYYQKLQLLGLPAIQSTVAFLRRLAGEKKALNLKLAVASGAARKELLTNLKNLQIDGLFDQILSGQDDLNDYHDDEGVNKPKSYIYLQAAKRLGVSPTDCVVIEDSLSGVLAGKSAGCLTIAVPNNYTHSQDLSRADLVIESFATLSPSQFLKQVSQLSQRQ